MVVAVLFMFLHSFLWDLIISLPLTKACVQTDISTTKMHLPRLFQRGQLALAKKAKPDTMKSSNIWRHTALANQIGASVFQECRLYTSKSEETEDAISSTMVYNSELYNISSRCYYSLVSWLFDKPWRTGLDFVQSISTQNSHVRLFSFTVCSYTYDK